MTDDRLTSDELFAIFKGLIPTPVAFYLMNGGAKLDRGALEMVQAVREQATTDRIEAQAAEIERLRSMVLEGAAKNAAEIVRLELEVERLRGLLDAWLNLAEEHLDTELAGRTFAALEDAKRGRPAKTAPAEE
jgi:hypothetical protein